MYILQSWSNFYLHLPHLNTLKIVCICSHSFISKNLLLIRIAANLKSIPGTLVIKQEYNLDGMPGTI